ncbi:MAG: flagellar basal body rod protein FlgB [Fibrobacter sp.]|nr:flagellar basal body rod protein FlgB [Fibrobacter sp.]
MILKNTVFQHTSIPTLKKSLDAASLRGKAIANNIANVNTPGYRRIEVAFEDKLKDALDEHQKHLTRTNKNHAYGGRPHIEMLKPIAYRSDDITQPGEENNVDIDMENAKLAETQLHFDFTVRFLRDRLETIADSYKIR